MDREAKQRELEQMRQAVQRLERELAEAQPGAQWPPPSYYAAYHVLAGFVLGMFGAATSLLFNVVGALLTGHYPLQLIRVFLTFPLGSAALELGEGSHAVNDSLALATGCCLYLGTGMIFGIPFHLVLTRWFPTATFAVRLAVVSALALGLWLLNFYAILSWLQPALFDGRWIVDLIPWWVAAVTHLVFGWTMLLVQPLGSYVPYQQATEAK